VADASLLVGTPAPDRRVGRSDLFGGLEDALGTDHLYQAGGRFVMDVQGLFWKLEYVGVGAGYFGSDNFPGWTVGAETRFAF
jgi:hypothetical protein